MARILKCPDCGALWRLPDGVRSDAPLECGACGRRFSASSAEGLEVPDDVLERLPAGTSGTVREAPATTPTPAEPVVPTIPAPPVSGLREEPPEAAAAPHAGTAASPDASAAEKQAVAGETDGERTAGPLGTFLLLVLGLLFAAVICAGALLFFNGWVLDRAPWLRPVYENVCTKLPCPGFSWSDPSALEIRTSLRDDPALGLLLPSVYVTVFNVSTLPQQLPVLELKVFDASEEVIATRVLEPADYGYPQKPAVLPPDAHVESLIHFSSTLAAEAAGVQVRIVTPEAAR